MSKIDKAVSRPKSRLATPDSAGARGIMFIYWASGLCSLIDEVVWVRLLKLTVKHYRLVLTADPDHPPCKLITSLLYKGCDELCLASPLAHARCPATPAPPPAHFRHELQSKAQRFKLLLSPW